MENNLERFKQAQAGTYGGYATALEEVKRGKKTSHWIWYIFPQLKGLGRTSTSDYYGIANLEEAKAYLADETLGTRLREITQTLLEHADVPIRDIFDQDAIKVRSCMTLFDMVSPHDIFATVLETFFHGSKDKLTIRKCQGKIWFPLRPEHIIIAVVIYIIAIVIGAIIIEFLWPWSIIIAIIGGIIGLIIGLLSLRNGGSAGENALGDDVSPRKVDTERWKLLSLRNGGSAGENALGDDVSPRKVDTERWKNERV